MKKVTILFTILMSISNIGFSQRIDTLYYDDQWHGVDNSTFATYIRYAYYAPENSNFKNRFKTFYSNGELYSEGEFTTIDRYDDSKSQLGSFKTYYKNGKLQQENNIINGNGNYIMYYENGNKKEEGSFKNGKFYGDAITYWGNGLIHTKGFYADNGYKGIYYIFSENGNECAQYEYVNGEISKPYYTYVTSSGTITKYKTKDNTLYLEQPAASEKQTYHDKGTTWDYYNKNGLTLMVNGSINRDYGKYITLSIVLSNNSNVPVVFNPGLITAYKEHKGKTTSLKPMEASEYMSKVTNRQNWNMFFNALNENMAASKAGYSSSTTQTGTVYGGQSVTGAVGAAVGTNGAAVGVGVAATDYSGYTATTSTTTSYNGAAAYQAQLIASNRVASYNSVLLNERSMKEENYLKITTINPKEAICGYINIPYSKGDSLTVNIVIDNIVYPFSWNMSN